MLAITITIQWSLTYPEYSLIRTPVWNQITFLTIKWFTYPEIQLYGRLPWERRCPDKWGSTVCPLSFHILSSRSIKSDWLILTKFDMYDPQGKLFHVTQIEGLWPLGGEQGQKRENQGKTKKPPKVQWLQLNQWGRDSKTKKQGKTGRILHRAKWRLNECLAFYSKLRKLKFQISALRYTFWLIKCAY